MKVAGTEHLVLCVIAAKILENQFTKLSLKKFSDSIAQSDPIAHEFLYFFTTRFTTIPFSLVSLI